MIKQVISLNRQLTYSSQMCTPNKAFLDSLAVDESMSPEAFVDSPDAFKQAPYRRKLSHMHFRLQQNLKQVKARLKDKAIETTTLRIPI